MSVISWTGPTGGRDAGTKRKTLPTMYNTTRSFHANTKSGSGWFKHLSGYAAILVQVVQIEGPVELVDDGASQNDGQTYDKVLQQDKEKIEMTEIKVVIATSEEGAHLVEMKARGTGKDVCCPQ